MEAARVAEEAAPGALGVDALNVDCWGPAGDGVVDAETASECARSRAANDYEARKPGHSHGHSHDHGEAPSEEIGPDGLPASGEVQGYYSWIADVEGASGEEIAAHAASYEAGARGAVRTGHGAAAVEGRAPLAAAAVEAAVEQQEMTPRVYFKNPCNNPALNAYYKNPANSPAYQGARMYYKNPANVPDFFPGQVAPAPVAPAASASISATIVSFWSAQPQMLAAIVAGLLGAAALALMQGDRPRRRTAAGTESVLSEEADALLSEAVADLEARTEDSPRKAAAFPKLAGSPSPRKAGGGAPAGAPRVLPGAAEGGDVDVVRSGAVDSPRRAATPLMGRAVTPLSGRGGGARAGVDEAE
ncbi:MAG: hypothetical protein J3K34DRAFT_444811 [Monoraphidium minutum]|nr:MAG: hypothetical protein J3K34DRAFT_444811 [Monoraphidium minutum]